MQILSLIMCFQTQLQAVMAPVPELKVGTVWAQEIEQRFIDQEGITNQLYRYHVIKKIKKISADRIVCDVQRRLTHHEIEGEALPAPIAKPIWATEEMDNNGFRVFPGNDQLEFEELRIQQYSDVLTHPEWISDRELHVAVAAKSTPDSAGWGRTIQFGVKSFEPRTQTYRRSFTWRETGMTTPVNATGSLTCQANSRIPDMIQTTIPQIRIPGGEEKFTLKITTRRTSIEG